MRHNTGEKTGHGAPARAKATGSERVPSIRRFRGLLECAFSVSLCHYAGHFKKAATLFFCAAAGGIGGKRMTIRALVKASNTVQLILLLLLAACFFWLGQNLKNFNALLRGFYQTEALINEITVNARNKYHLALDFVAERNMASLESWQSILSTESGSLTRPETSALAPSETRSLAEIAAGLELGEDERALFNFLLDQNSLLSRMTEIAVMRARGVYPDTDGRFSVQGKNEPEKALQWMYDTKLVRIPDKINSAAKQLRARLYQTLVDHMAAQRSVLWWTLGFALCALALLALNVGARSLFFHRRIVRPLALVSRYAEEVAAGGDPPPLHLHNGDELTGMFDSLQKMKGALLSRIQDLKLAERTARKSRQQALLARGQALASLELAQRASRVQEEFLRRISHEIRTPMNAIIGMSYLCLQTDLNLGQRDYITKINKSGSVLLDMFNRILDFSSANDGTMRLEHKPFALEHFLELLRQSMAGIALEKGLSFDLEQGPGLPSWVLGDERHLEEALRILLDNAVKYTARGGVRFTVARAPRESPPGQARLRFTVSDTGPGIGKEAQEKMFEPFVAGDESMTRAQSGLGLGLALARHLVELMGGELVVDSEPGKGSRLSFELIFAVAAEAAGGRADRGQALDLLSLSAPAPPTAPAPAAPRDETSAPPVQEGLAAVEDHPAEAPLVLVVDDNEINRQIAQELLEQAGLKVALAADGQEAVAQVQARDFDLVIMDVQMPVMDGMEATRRIRGLGRTPRTLPVLAMTAHTDASSRIDGMGVGMNDYLTKPVDPAALYAALEKWLPGGLANNPMRAEGATAEGEKTAQKAAPDNARPAVNLDAGLATVGGNKKLFNELLARFVEHYGQSAAQMRELLGRRDYRGAARLAHTVKGVAANLGVERVTELTKNMEACLPDVPPRETLLRQFEEAMREALTQIETLRAHSRISTDGDLLLADEHRQALLRLLEELPRRMELDWGSVESALAGFLPLVEGTPHAEELAEVLAAVDDFDPAAVTERAARLRQKLTGEVA